MVKLVYAACSSRLARCLPVVLACMLAACATTELYPAKPAGTTTKSATGKTASGLPAAGSGKGGYYKDDGPEESVPQGLLEVPDAIPTIEPYRPANMRPYVVFGKTYTPIADERPYKQRGVGSWYGKRFHGQKTSSGELYDMYKMTAAHPTLPIPSYARVTNVRNGKSIIVRINDRGPFHSSRIIDLSYTAALKLDYLSSGSGDLEVERLLPDDIRQIQKNGTGTTTGAVLEEVTMPSVAVQTMEAPVVMSVPATTQTVANTQGAAPAAGGKGFYLQFGAYAKEENARAARDKLLQSLSGVVTQFEVVPVNGLYRLFSTAYSTRAAALSAAQQVQHRGINAPFVVER